jgi:hypothetical protein
MAAVILMLRDKLIDLLLGKLHIGVSVVVGYQFSATLRVIYTPFSTSCTVLECIHLRTVDLHTVTQLLHMLQMLD